jgi:hypothetical protein
MFTLLDLDPATQDDLTMDSILVILVLSSSIQTFMHQMQLEDKVKKGAHKKPDPKDQVEDEGPEEETSIKDIY